MKKLITVCVFKNPDFIQLLYMFLESLFIYGNLDENTDIIIYTSTEFMNIIKKSHFYCDKIFFEINDTYNDIYKACLSKMDIFNYSSIDKYERILYLDIDIIIIRDINPVFDIVEKNVIYALEEGTIEDDFWGKTLFGDEVHNYENKVAFSSGAMLFNNVPEIRNLYNTIKNDTKNREHWFADQPYFVYNAFKYNMYDNQKMKKFVALNDNVLPTDKTISHFACGPGEYIDKFVRMINFLTDLKDESTRNVISACRKYIDENLMPIIHRIGEPLEGNLFMLHHKYEHTDYFLHKLKNISVFLLNKNIKKVMEIGFNAGFSTLLMLMSNPNVHITCIDNGEHAYVIPCFNKLKETFGNRISLIIGDSRKVLPTMHATYDLIHIDGGLSDETVLLDIVNSYRMSRERTVFIMNDYNFDNVHKMWDNKVREYDLKEVNMRLYVSPHHDIRYK